MSQKSSDIEYNFEQVPKPGVRYKHVSLEEIRAACTERGWHILLISKYTITAMEFSFTKETVLEWNRLGLLVSRETDSDGADGPFTTKHSYTYDTDGRLTHDKVQDFKNGSWAIKRVLHYTYLSDDRFDFKVIPT